MTGLVLRRGLHLLALRVLKLGSNQYCWGCQFACVFETSDVICSRHETVQRISHKFLSVPVMVEAHIYLYIYGSSREDACSDTGLTKSPLSSVAYRLTEALPILLHAMIPRASDCSSVYIKVILDHGPRGGDVEGSWGGDG